MKLRILFTYLSLLLLFVRTVDAQKLCNINIEEEELSFKSHETLTYAASYSWGFLFTDVGEVVLKINKTKLFPIEYHVTADAKTYKFYDRFFKVRDFYESKFIIPDMRSIYFYRNILEGDYTMKNTYNFDWENNKINAVIQRQKAPAKNIEINLNTCTLDVLSYFYYLRNLDFSDACPNSVYVISIALDHEVYSIKCRFLGKEQKKIKALKTKINCLKFAVEVIAGNVFKGNESITMWVSDDKNHIPLELESPITVGKLKGRILKHENLKYPLNIVE